MPEPLILDDLTLDGLTNATVDAIINANADKIRLNPNGWIDTGATIRGTFGVYTEAPRFELTDFIRRIEELEQKYETLSTEFFRFKYDKSKFIANHSICYCRKKTGFWNEVLTADDIVRECVDFLRENPTETILLSYKRDDGANQEETFNTFFDAV